MATGYEIIVRHDDQIVAKNPVDPTGEPVKLAAQSDFQYELLDPATGVAPQQVLFKRAGDNLELHFGNEPSTAPADVIIEGYYAVDTAPKFLGLAEDGNYYLFVPQTGLTEDFLEKLDEEDETYQSLGYDDTNSEGAWWPWILGGLAVGGAIAALASGGGGGSHDDGNGDGDNGGGVVVPPKDPTGELNFNDGGDGKLNKEEAQNTTLSGKITDGEIKTITITDENGKAVVIEGKDITVGDNGSFTTSPQDLTGLKDGTLTAVLEFVDANGQVKKLVISFDADGNPTATTVLDTTPPETPNPHFEDDGKTIIGDDGEPNGEVIITIPGEDPITVPVDEDGHYELPLDEPLPDNTDVEVIGKDPAGNESEPGTITSPDFTAPEVHFDEGILDTPTNNAHPDLTGTVDDPKADIIVVIGGEEIPAENHGDGTWSLDGDKLPELEDGSIPVEVIARDPAGNEGTDNGNLELDTQAPEVHFDEGILDTPTNNAHPDLTGTVDDPKADIIVVIGGEEIPAENHGDGTWSLDGDKLPELEDGDIPVEVIARDPAGNEGTDNGDLELDTTPPDTPNPHFEDDGKTIIGDDGEPNGEVIITIPGEDPITVPVDEDGHYELPLDEPLPDNTDVEVIGKDPAGNESDPGTITSPDFTAPEVSFDEGILDKPTNNAHPDLTGTVDDPTADIIVVIGGEEIPAENHGDGTWSLDGDKLPELEDGDIPVKVIATDPAGNEGSDDGELLLDTTPPKVTLDEGTQNDETLTGTIDDPDADIVVVIGGKEYDAINNGDGTWSVDLPDGTLVEGNNDIEVIATDPAKNVGTDEGSINFDTTGPENGDGLNEIAFVDPNDDGFINKDESTQTNLTGKVEAGSTVNGIVITDGTNSIELTEGTDFTVGEDGTITFNGPFDLSDLNDGDITVDMDVNDPVGNNGHVTDEIELDATAPVVELNEGTQGNDTLTGTIDDPDADIVVVIGGKEYDAINNGDGTWSVDLPDGTLVEGNNDIEVIATDPAKNVGTDEGSINFDTTGPENGDGLNEIAFVDPNDDGFINKDESTQTNLTGKVEAGSTVNGIVITDGTNSIELTEGTDFTVGEDGTITFNGPFDLSDLNDGDITVDMDVNDPVGNNGHVTDEIELDATAPVVELNEGTQGNDTLTGTIDDPDADIVVKIGDEEYDAINNGNGTWSVDLPDGTLVEGNNNIEVIATDPAGNEGNDTGNINFDTTGPENGDGLNEIAFVDPNDDGFINKDESTQTNLTGKVEAGSTVNGIVITDGTNSIELTEGTDFTVGEDGTITFNGPFDLSDLNDGDITVDMDVNDPVGNNGHVTDEIELDTTPTDAPTVTFGENGDDSITADEIDENGNVTVHIELPENANVGDFLEVDGQEPRELTQVDLDNGVDLQVPAPTTEGEELTVGAIIRDKAGNESARGENTATLDLIQLGNDSADAVKVGGHVAETPLAEGDDQELIGLVGGQGEVMRLGFTIGEAQDVMAVVDNQNLLALAKAFQFDIVDSEGNVVATSGGTQGGLLGVGDLDALGAVGTPDSLALTHEGLPAGDYTLVVKGDSSELADVLKTIDLDGLGEGTLDSLVNDTVKSLLKNTLSNADAVESILKQLTVDDLLDLTDGFPVVGTLVDAVQTIVHLPLLKGVLGDLLGSSVDTIIKGEAGGLLGSLLSGLGLGPALSGLLDGIVGNLDAIGDALYDSVLDPILDTALDTLDGTGLTDLLEGVLGGVNDLLTDENSPVAKLLAGLGIDNVLGSVEDLLGAVADHILSNPVELFDKTHAAVYAFDGYNYEASGDILENDHISDKAADHAITSVNGEEVNFDQSDDLSDEHGNYTTITGEYGELKLYEDGHFEYTTGNEKLDGVVEDKFTYEVGGETADLIIKIDPSQALPEPEDDETPVDDGTAALNAAHFADDAIILPEEHDSATVSASHDDQDETTLADAIADYTSEEEELVFADADDAQTDVEQSIAVIDSPTAIEIDGILFNDGAAIPVTPWTDEDSSNVGI